MSDFCVRFLLPFSLTLSLTKMDGITDVPKRRFCSLTLLVSGPLPFRLSSGLRLWESIDVRLCGESAFQLYPLPATPRPLRWDRKSARIHPPCIRTVPAMFPTSERAGLSDFISCRPLLLLILLSQSYSSSARLVFHRSGDREGQT